MFKRWDEIEIGDLVYLRKNEKSPADLLIIDHSTSILQV